MVIMPVAQITVSTFVQIDAQCLRILQSLSGVPGPADPRFFVTT